MFTRRKFVSSVGASLIAAPFLDTLNGVALAQPVNAPAKRLLVFFSPDGIVPRFYWPEGGENDFRFPDTSVLSPLTRHRDDLLVLRGVDMPTGNHHHNGGLAAMLTNVHMSGLTGDLPNPDAAMGSPTTRIPGADPNSGQRRLNTNAMSIDQVIAQQIGGGDRFSSLPLGVLTDPMGASIWTRMCYGGPGQFVHPDSDPRSVFQRMFGGVSDDAAALERLQRRRRSVLDIVLNDLNGIRRRVGREERVKLDMHLQGIREVERGLFFAQQAECETPNAPAQMNKDEYALIPQITRSQIDLAVTALACQMTKVTSIQVSHPVSRAVFSWVGNVEEHHDLSHATDAEPERIAQYLLAERWCTEQFAYVIDKLKATPNPDGGGTLFDDTVVLWAQEVGDSRTHESVSVPFMLAGSGGGAFRPGRYLQYDRVPHSRLLVSICRAFGMELDTFGDPGTGAGGLDGLA
jgi:hypothetical protein